MLSLNHDRLRFDLSKICFLVYGCRFDQGQIAPKVQGYGAGLYGIYSSDSTFSQIIDFSAHTLSKSVRVEGCSDPGVYVGGVTDCSSTSVSGIAGTGFEGPDCNLDINECVRGTSGCPDNSACVNTEGGFRYIAAESSSVLIA